MRPRLGLLALPVVALAIAGCASTLDTDKIEDEIRKEVEESSRGQAQVASVDCPDDVDAEKGHRFTCTVRGQNGATTKASVVQTSDDGDVRFNVNYNALLGGG